MNRAVHLQTAGVDRILLEGVIDGRPFRERQWHHKQGVYLAPSQVVSQFLFAGIQADYSQLVEAELSMADLGYPFAATSETFSGWADFVTDEGAPLPVKIQDLATGGQISLSTFDSILLESPPSGALTGGPTLATAAIPGDLNLTGTNLTAVAPVESKLLVVEPGRIDGVDATVSRAFGATKYLFVRNQDWQSWLRIGLTGTLTAAQCVAAINDAVAAYAQSVGKLRPMFPPRGSWDAGYYPNIFAVTPAPGGAANTIGLYAHGEASRIEVASVADVEAVVGVGNSANVLLLGLGAGALSNVGAGTRGTVVHADIVHGGTTLSVGVGDVPVGTAIGDIVYVNINGRDLHVLITS
jgi:hypothetical protein